MSRSNKSAKFQISHNQQNQFLLEIFLLDGNVPQAWRWLPFIRSCEAHFKVSDCLRPVCGVSIKRQSRKKLSRGTFFPLWSLRCSIFVEIWEFRLGTEFKLHSFFAYVSPPPPPFCKCVDAKCFLWSRRPLTKNESHAMIIKVFITSPRVTKLKTVQ